MDKDKPQFIRKGWQEFGSSLIETDGAPGTPSFIQTSTGKTFSRALDTPVYGPYVRLELKNLDTSARAKFRIAAFLTK